MSQEKDVRRSEDGFPSWADPALVVGDSLVDRRMEIAGSATVCSVMVGSSMENGPSKVSVDSWTATDRQTGDSTYCGLDCDSDCGSSMMFDVHHGCRHPAPAAPSHLHTATVPPVRSTHSKDNVWLANSFLNLS